MPVRASPILWVGRGLLAATALVAAYNGGRHALAQRLALSDPAAAHRLAPHDGRITGLLAASLIGSDRRSAAVYARKALRQDPIGVAAVATLGVDAQERGDIMLARRLFGYSQQLSRRDRTTQLWAIEDAVSREDVPDSLNHYDIALRTSPDLSKLLFPVLASASSDPTIRTALIQTLAGRPDWGNGFIYYMTGSGTDPQASAALLLGLERARVPVVSSAWARTINALIDHRLFDRAWSYYAAIRSGVDRGRSRDPGFTANFATPTLLDWIAVNDGNIATIIQDGVFDFQAPANTGGPLLRQFQLLPFGEYRLVGHSKGIEQTGDTQPYWVLSCLDDRELGRVSVPNSDRDNGQFTGVFRVPEACPLQILTLMARPSDVLAGLAGQIDKAELVAVH